MIMFDDIKSLNDMEPTLSNDAWNEELVKASVSLGVSVETILGLIEQYNTDPESLKKDLDGWLEAEIARYEEECRMREDAEDPVYGCDPYNDEALLQGVI